jgi:hypothetical protein
MLVKEWAPAATPAGALSPPAGDAVPPAGGDGAA